MGGSHIKERCGKGRYVGKPDTFNVPRGPRNRGRPGRRTPTFNFPCAVSPMLRLPPRIKVLEALAALADGRVALDGERCLVASSEGDRAYSVYVSGGKAYSDDNGTLLKGYVGYPILACLMARGVLPVDWDLARSLRGIPWRRLNAEYKNYARVMEAVLGERGIDRRRADRYIDEVLRVLGGMRLELTR